MKVKLSAATPLRTVTHFSVSDYVLGVVHYSAYLQAHSVPTLVLSDCSERIGH